MLTNLGGVVGEAGMVEEGCGHLYNINYILGLVCSYHAEDALHTKTKHHNVDRNNGDLQDLKH